jgi:hypothetical protein
MACGETPLSLSSIAILPKPWKDDRLTISIKRWVITVFMVRSVTQECENSKLTLIKYSFRDSSLAEEEVFENSTLPTVSLVTHPSNKITSFLVTCVMAYWHIDYLNVPCVYFRACIAISPWLRHHKPGRHWYATHCPTNHFSWKQTNHHYQL